MLNRLNSKLEKHIPALIALWRKNSGMKGKLLPRELESVSRSLVALQRGLTGDRKLAGAGYMDRADFLGAYLLYYWPVSYMQISFEANAIRQYLRKGDLRILDIGSGPAPASAALCDMFNVRSVTLVDSSGEALSLAEKIFKSEWKDCSVKTYVHNFEKGNIPSVEGNFDIIVLSHSLNELWTEYENAVERRAFFLQELACFLSDGGILLVSEPALLSTSNALIKVRDVLITKGFSVVSPCLTSDSCPVSCSGGGQTCHAEVEWKGVEPVTSIARLAGLDRQSVKMAYMAFCRDYKNTAYDKGEYLVVSDGMLNKSGRVRFLFCDGKNRIPCSAKKIDSHAEGIGFFKLHRYDRVMLKNPELRGSPDSKAFGIVDDTELSVKKFTEESPGS